MEKQGVVKAGKTPCEETGNKSCMIKNGEALAKGESPVTAKETEKLVNIMKPLYNSLEGTNK